MNIIDIYSKTISKKSFEVTNDYYGFIKLKEMIDILSVDYNFTYEEIIIGV